MHTDALRVLLTVISLLEATTAPVAAQERPAEARAFDPRLQREFDRRGELLSQFVQETDASVRIELAESVRQIERQLLTQDLPEVNLVRLNDEHQGLLIWLAEQYDLRQPELAVHRWDELVELRKSMFHADHWQVRSAIAGQARVRRIVPLTAEQCQELKRAAALREQAQQRLVDGDLQRAAAQLRESARLQIAILGADLSTSAVALKEFAEVLLDLGEADQATILLTKAVDVAESSVGGNHPLTISMLNDLARALHRSGQSRNAAEVQMRAVRGARETFGDGHPEFASNISNLAILLGEMGDPRQGMNFALRADAILAGHENLLEARAENLNVIGVLAMRLRLHQRALQAYEQAARLQEQVNGPDHPHNSVALGNAAMAALELNRVPLAATYLNQSLAIIDRTVGRDHTSAAERLMQLASLHRAQGRSKEIEPLVRQASESLRIHLGDDHPAYAQSLNQLAVLLADRGRFDEAEDLLLRATEIQERALGPRSGALAITLTNLARVQARRQNGTITKQLLRVAGEIAVEALGHKHPEYAGHLRRAASIYGDVREHGLAKAALTEAVGILEAELGEKHPEYAKAISELGLVMIQSDEGDRGRALMEQGHQLLIEVVGRRHPDAVDSVLRLAQASRMLETPAEAIGHLIDVEGIVREQLGPKHETYGVVLLELGKSLLAGGETERGQQALQRAGTLFIEQLGEESPQAVEALRLANMAANGDPRLIDELGGKGVSQAVDVIAPSVPAVLSPAQVSPEQARQTRVVDLIQRYLR